VGEGHAVRGGGPRSTDREGTWQDETGQRVPTAGGVCRSLPDLGGVVRDQTTGESGRLQPGAAARETGPTVEERGIHDRQPTQPRGRPERAIGKGPLHGVGQP